MFILCSDIKSLSITLSARWSLTSIAFRKCVRVCPSQRVDSPWQVFTIVARSNQMYNYELQPGGASDNKRSHTCMGFARDPLFFNNSSTCLCQSKRKLRIRLRRKLPLGGNFISHSLFCIDETNSFSLHLPVLLS